MSTLMKVEKKNKLLVQERFLQLEIVEKIFEVMEKKGISQKDLAKKMKLSKSQVSRLLADDRNLTIASISKIFSALDEELSIMTKSEAHSLSECKIKTETVFHMVEVPYKRLPTVASGVFAPTLYNQPVNIKR